MYQKSFPLVCIHLFIQHTVDTQHCPTDGGHEDGQDAFPDLTEPTVVFSRLSDRLL